MKCYLFLVLLIPTHYFVSAQTIYTHDTSGNRTKRSDAPALPVTLISFEATKINVDQDVSASVLEWETSVETNSDFFEIERSPDAKCCTYAHSQMRNLQFESRILAYPNPVKQFLKLTG